MGEVFDRSRFPAWFVANYVRLLNRNPFRRKPEWGEDLDRRAAIKIASLENPSQRLRFRVFLETVADGPDLFIEDYAVNDHCLALQVRLFELAKDFPAARATCINLNATSLAAKIFVEIVRTGALNGYSMIQLAPEDTGAALSVGNEIGVLQVFYWEVHGWVLNGQLPSPQAESLLGLIRRIDALGYLKYKEYLSGNIDLPKDLKIEWVSDVIARIIL
jgi:hypothetical protein